MKNVLIEIPIKPRHFEDIMFGLSSLPLLSTQVHFATSGMALMIC